MNWRSWHGLRLFHVRLALASSTAFLLVASAGGCSGQGTAAADAHAFVLRSPGADLDGASMALTQAFLREAGTSDFGPGFPLAGYASTNLQYEEPGAVRIQCIPGPSVAHSAKSCVLLTKQGDFVWIQPHERLTALWFPLIVYVVPPFHLGSVDPMLTGALGVRYIPGEDSPNEMWTMAIWGVTDRTMRDALRRLGGMVYGTGRP